jgi:hypothetical protein
MQQLFEYLINDICDQNILREEANLLIEEEMLNESFKCELLTNLAAEIKKAEKKNNTKRAERNKESEAKGYSSREAYVSFASIFGPLTERGRYSTKKGIQGLRWSEFTEDDFTLVKAGNEKELKKALRPIYAKNGKGDAIICEPGTKNPVMFIKGYGKDDDKQLFFFDYNDKHWKNGVVEKTATKYSYQTRSLKLEEVMPLISDLDVYILNITDETIKQYKTLFDTRAAEKEGSIEYDEQSLKDLLKKQQARYKTLVAEIKAKKLQRDPNVLFDEIKATNDEVVALYKEVMSSPENLDKFFDMGRLMTYISYAYESFYKSMKEDREADRAEKRFGSGRDSWSRERSREEIRDAKDYLEKVKKSIEDIKKELKGETTED